MTYYHIILQEKVSELIASGDYERDDFTVVIQPFFEGVQLPYKVLSIFLY